jgi:antitoxin (DNA-binding transcriptional repressor) of toxin-antitoxin stability system
MSEQVISVTQAARNFADCINRARYQGTTFLLQKNGVSVARIVPEEQKSCTALELAAVLEQVSLTPEESASWLHDLEEARKSVEDSLKLIEPK